MVGTDLKLVLFRHLVVSTEHGNLLKKHINASRQLCRDDPSVTTVVSDDELEDSMLLRTVPELPGPRVWVGSGFGFRRTWLQQAGRCADSSFVSGI